uniref:PSI domain-containing protein n=1 Tax=Enterobius vermicularis TaxID=51028 RepID=A0A0N4V5B8_ENTVE
LFSVLPTFDEFIGSWLDYDFVPPYFSSLESRKKRGLDDDEGVTDDDLKIPSDVEVSQIDYKYYVLETYTNRSDMVKTHYFDIEEMLKKPGTVGNISHPLLSKSYRRAVAARIQFEFPFYGFRMKNLTIATGGFSYVGEQFHSWLAATQYIAPLMANFDTYAENSTIMYADDGEKFVIEWKNLQLRTQKTDGYFTFQLSLHKNGDIWFVYIDIPIPVGNISGSHHPVKIGVSDLKLHDQNLILYEYHRIEVDPKFVTSNTVIRLIAQPACIQYHTCEECSNATLSHFNCSWCHSKAEHGGPFCSDTAGLHRRRQHWLDANCKNIGKVTYCSSEDDYKEVEEETLTSPPDNPGCFIFLLKNSAKTDDESKTSLSAGYIWLFVIFILIALVVCWFAYAYFHPQTASGQFLIKYRLSQWRMPSSHVRYSASVHM